MMHTVIGWHSLSGVLMNVANCQPCLCQRLRCHQCSAGVCSCAVACTLQVPGLAEARPSVLRGDALYVSHADGSGGGKEWQGIVHNVGRDAVSCAEH